MPFSGNFKEILFMAVTATPFLGLYTLYSSLVSSIVYSFLSDAINVFVGRQFTAAYLTAELCVLY